MSLRPSRARPNPLPGGDNEHGTLRELAGAVGVTIPVLI